MGREPPEDHWSSTRVAASRGPGVPAWLRLLLGQWLAGRALCPAELKGLVVASRTQRRITEKCPSLPPLSVARKPNFSCCSSQHQRREMVGYEPSSCPRSGMLLVGRGGYLICIEESRVRHLDAFSMEVRQPKRPPGDRRRREGRCPSGTHSHALLCWWELERRGESLFLHSHGKSLTSENSLQETKQKTTQGRAVLPEMGKWFPQAQPCLIE